MYGGGGDDGFDCEVGDDEFAAIVSRVRECKSSQTEQDEAPALLRRGGSSASDVLTLT